MRSTNSRPSARTRSLRCVNEVRSAIAARHGFVEKLPVRQNTQESCSHDTGAAFTKPLRVRHEGHDGHYSLAGSVTVEQVVVRPRCIQLERHPDDEAEVMSRRQGWRVLDDPLAFRVACCKDAGEGIPSNDPYLDSRSRCERQGTRRHPPCCACARRQRHREGEVKGAARCVSGSHANRDCSSRWQFSAWVWWRAVRPPQRRRARSPRAMPPLVR